MRRRPLIMGILNVTPDSFYDGGKFNNADAAVERALHMFNEGADIIDIGGESTGPGSSPIGVEEELGRVMPVIERIRAGAGEFPLSVDTYKAEVAKKALEAGADMINDVSAGRADPGMLAVIAETGCPYVMMRSKDETPHVSMEYVQYDDGIHTIYTFFTHRIAVAEAAGVRRDQIILDPGLGHFVSSDPKYSWEILERLEEFQSLGCPILVSPSRKSFTAVSPSQPPSERLEGTLRATKLALERGAGIIRTHDVFETKKMKVKVSGTFISIAVMIP